MQVTNEQSPAPSRRFFLAMMLLGTAVGVALLLIDAPIWFFYVAPLLAVPLLIHQLRTLDREQQSRAQNAPSAPARPVDR